jgi:hypothetical protein
VAGVRAASVYSATVCAWVDMTAGSTRADANQETRGIGTGVDALVGNTKERLDKCE